MSLGWNLGAWWPFGGVLTFNNAEAAREGAAYCPEDKLLTETDAPYMAPVPLRGTDCAPEQVVFTAQKLLEVRSKHWAPCMEQRRFLQQVHDNALGFLDRRPSAWQLQQVGVR